MLADDSPNLSIYLSLYALGQVEYNWYWEKLTLAILSYLFYKYTKKVWDYQTFLNQLSQIKKLTMNSITWD